MSASIWRLVGKSLRVPDRDDDGPNRAGMDRNDRPGPDMHVGAPIIASREAVRRRRDRKSCKPARKSQDATERSRGDLICAGPALIIFGIDPSGTGIERSRRE